MRVFNLLATDLITPVRNMFMRWRRDGDASLEVGMMTIFVSLIVVHAARFGSSLSAHVGEAR